MSVAELKNDLHRLIVETEDETFLEEIRLAFEYFQQGERAVDWWDTIGEKGRAAIKKGLQQAEEGKVIPHAEVRKEIDQLFEEARKARQ